MSNWNKSKEKLDYGAVEPGVRELVRALNTCKYLYTVSSCEGHGDMIAQPFHVRCEFKDINFLKILIKHIHFHFFAIHDQWGDFLPDTSVRYWAMPHDTLMDVINEQFIIRLDPTGFHNIPAQDRNLKKVADALVSAVMTAIKEAEDIWEVKA